MRVDKQDRRREAARKRADGYKILSVKAPPSSTEREWHRVQDLDGRLVGTFSTRKAATDAISKDKKRMRQTNPINTLNGPR